MRNQPLTANASPLGARTEASELASPLSLALDAASVELAASVVAMFDDCDSASEVIELLAGSDPVLGVDALLRSGKKVVLYRSNPGAC